MTRKSNKAASTTPIYPDLTVLLSGEDGNAFAILARMRQSMRLHGIEANRISAFITEATQGDYDHLLRTCQKWVTVM